jgi:hypothetical protein
VFNKSSKVNDKPFLDHVCSIDGLGGVIFSFGCDTATTGTAGTEEVDGVVGVVFSFGCVTEVATIGEIAVATDTAATEEFAVDDDSDVVVGGVVGGVEDCCIVGVVVGVVVDTDTSSDVVGVGSGVGVGNTFSIVHTHCWIPLIQIDHLTA